MQGRQGGGGCVSRGAAAAVASEGHDWLDILLLELPPARTEGLLSNLTARLPLPFLAPGPERGGADQAA